MDIHGMTLPLYLSKPLVYNKNTREIPLISRPLQAEEEAYISGWGVQDNKGTMPKFLKALRVQVFEGFLCKLLNKLVGSVCVVTSIPGGMCFGDFGGPLTVQGQLAGIASFSFRKECDTPESRMLYTSVFDYKDWIEQKIGVQRSDDTQKTMKL